MDWEIISTQWTTGRGYPGRFEGARRLQEIEFVGTASNRRRTSDIQNWYEWALDILYTYSWDISLEHMLWFFENFDLG